MVQGLGFLSKKSWHTKNKANQEKVWLAEQRKEQETAKAKELAREIQQEREAEEFNRIAGKKPVLDRGIDWMYQDQVGSNSEVAKEDAAKKAEEYLLGKEYVGEGAVQGDFHDGDQKEGIHSALSKTEAVVTTEVASKPQEPSGPDVDSVKYRNEHFTMRVEDPMFMVSQKQHERQDKHDKAKALYERVVGPVGDKGSSDDDASSASSEGNRKRSKKDRKRHKKKKKKKSSKKSKRDNDDYDSRGRDSRRRHRRRSRSRSPSRSWSRSRSRSPDRYNRRDKHYDRGYDSRSDGSYDSRRDRYSDRDRSRERDRERVRDRDRDRSNHRRDRDHRTRRHFDDDDRRERDRDRTDNRRHSRHEGRRYEDDRMNNSPPRKNAPDPIQDNRPRRIEGYGLKGGPAPVVGNRDIGPSRELLRKKREEEENLRNRNQQIGKSRKRMTAQERSEALQKMQEDARRREDRMVQQASHRRDNDEDETGNSTKKGASFLKDITTTAHGISSDASSSLAARVAQNRHTNQRIHDSFL